MSDAVGDGCGFCFRRNRALREQFPSGAVAMSRSFDVEIVDERIFASPLVEQAAILEIYGCTIGFNGGIGIPSGAEIAIHHFGGRRYGRTVNDCLGIFGRPDMP